MAVSDEALPAVLRAQAESIATMLRDLTEAADGRDLTEPERAMLADIVGLVTRWQSVALGEAAALLAQHGRDGEAVRLAMGDTAPIGVVQ